VSECASAASVALVIGRFTKAVGCTEQSAHFDKHANHSDIPLLVDFWADRCGPLPGDGADLRAGGNRT
jgi:hypothetical protein